MDGLVGMFTSDELGSLAQNYFIAALPIGMRIAFERPEWARAFLLAMEHYAKNPWTDGDTRELDEMIARCPMEAYD